MKRVRATRETKDDAALARKLVDADGAETLNEAAALLAKAAPAQRATSEREVASGCGPRLPRRVRRARESHGAVLRRSLVARDGCEGVGRRA
jgi:hypothetical protein